MTIVPRPSSTICAFRDGPAGCEVLMVQRGPSARFMANAWVFPGGVVDGADDDLPARSVAPGDGEAAWLRAAVRELVEETQVWITTPPPNLTEPEEFRRGPDVYAHAAATGRRFDLTRLTYFANWVTPEPVPMRFDTRFYAVAVTPDTPVHPDPVELADAEWVRPSVALERGRAGDWLVPFPTAKTLDLFTPHAGIDDLFAALAARHPVARVQPRLRVSPGGLEIVLPGEPGFDELDDSPGDLSALAKAARQGTTDGTPLPELDTDAN